MRVSCREASTLSRSLQTGRKRTNRLSENYPQESRTEAEVFSLIREYTLSAGAESDIADIYDYTERTRGPDEADAYTLALFREIQLRADNPYHASRNESVLASRLGLQVVRSFLYKGQHRCYFTFNNERLMILAVYHGRRDSRRISGG
ncbi:MAG TPA: type II toxin-antitoxin system RelE/ParE family toxin [Phycisphaerales bacterium]|nr:type II toxin-antitoxin system RelE/ParE family toxin [Phycisphaerales bacterium]